MSKTIAVAGVTALLENIPGSGITRVTIAGAGCFAFEAQQRRFSVFGDTRFTPVVPDLPELQLKGLVLALVKHDAARRRRIAQHGLV
jgi:hypothetical protein